ncbi:MAG: peptidylprolyl isomerase [Armatimonadota bacterium]|nr:peptidylprolyl isomerase [bacterium]
MTTEDSTQSRPLPWGMIAIVAVIVLGIAYYTFNYIRNARIEASTVVARVNGEPIYAADVNRGLPDDSFDSTTNDMKQNKIMRLISQMAIRQFLSKHGVQVREDIIEKEIGKMEQNPPSMGCPCCTYPSLDAYLSAVGYTRDELRLEIRNSIGLSDYARRSWEKSHPDKSAVLKEIGGQSTYIRQHYVKAWQIFFNTFQQPGYNTDPGKITKAAGQKAQKAWDRLQRGESFEAVAKSVSEDMTSKHKGGMLGFIDRSSYGEEFANTISKLKPGAYSKPFESSWGCHIVKWEPMSDGDIVKFCESYFVDKENKSIYSQIMKSAKVERPKSSDSGS